MFEKSKYKSFYTAGLGVIVLAVWAYNIFQFVDIAESKEKVVTEIPDMETIKTNFEVRDTVAYTFKGKYRDPFSYTSLRKEVTVEKSPKQKNDVPPKRKQSKPIRLPDIKLTGVIEMTAIIKAPDNTTHFRNRGEEINEILVQSIWNDSVRVEYKGKSFMLKIAN